MTSHYGDETAANEAMLAILFLLGADKVRFGELQTRFSDSFLTNKNEYPNTLDEAYDQLMKHQETHKNRGDNSDINSEGTAFAQRFKNMKCYICDKVGHIGAQCPEKDKPQYKKKTEKYEKTFNQFEDDDKSDSSNQDSQSSGTGFRM